MSLQEQVDAWLKSDNGRKKVNKVLKDKVKSGITHTAAGSRIVPKENISSMIAKLLVYIRVDARRTNVPEHVVKYMKMGQVRISDPVPTKNGDLMIEIRFGNSDDDLHRDSLYTEGYPDGIDSIVALFNNGYRAKHHVYGEWDGTPFRDGESYFIEHDGVKYAYIQSRKSEKAHKFVQNGIREFNKKEGAALGAKAIPSPLYSLKHGEYENWDGWVDSSH